MGAYRSKPLLDKISVDGEGNGVRYGVSEMQGWRVSMEDAWTCLPKLDERTSMFAVFDGHGGHEVAHYCSKKLSACIVESSAYKNGDLSQSLDQAFRTIDKSLLDEEVIQELKELAGDESDDDDDDEIAKLSEEATMPIQEVLDRLKKGADAEEFEELIQSYKSKSDFQVHKEKDPVMTVDSNLQHCERQSAQYSDSLSSVGMQSMIMESGSNAHKTENQRCKVALENGGKRMTSLKIKGGDVDNDGNSDNNDDDDDVEDDDDHNDDNDDDDDDNNVHDDDNVHHDDDSNEDAIDNADDDEDDDDDDDDADCDDDEDENTGGYSADSDDLDNDDRYVRYGGDGLTDINVTDVKENDEVGNTFPLESDEVGKDSGTTAIVVLLRENHLVVANAGDSRCVLCRGTAAVDMSIDHKPEDTSESERIIKAGGTITDEGRINGGLNLSRAIGDHNYKTNDHCAPHEQAIIAVPDIKETKITKEDKFVIIACDGIWNSISSQEAVDFVSAGVEDQLKDGNICISRVCEQLFDKCLAPDTTGDGSGCDNMTCIIVLFTDNLASNSSTTRKRTDIHTVNEQQSKKQKLSL